MKTRVFSASVLALLGVAAMTATPAEAWRGGGFGGFRGGGGFVARGPEGGVVAGYHGPSAWHAGGVAGAGWHGGAYGYHGGYWGGGYGYHGPAVVNSYVGGGCYGCGAAAVGAAAAVGTAAVVGAAEMNAARNYAIGATLATLPPNCATRIVNGAAYSICGSTWFAPRYGGNGLYFVAVPPL